MYMDTMYINGIPFLTLIVHPIYYRLCVWVEDKTTQAYYHALDKMICVFNSSGHQISIIECDSEYQPLMDPISNDMDIAMNYCNSQDDIPTAEWNNWTIKEAIRTLFHWMIYKCIPKIMIIELAQLCTSKLNMFPVKHGVSSYYSPEALVTNKTIDYNKDCQFSFGEYVQAHTQNNPTNLMTKQTIDDIYIRPTTSHQSGHVIMNLQTGILITQGWITSLPLPTTIKECMEDMAM